MLGGQRKVQPGGGVACSPSSVQRLVEMLFIDRCSWEWGAQMGRDTFFSLSFFLLNFLLCTGV